MVQENKSEKAKWLTMLWKTRRLNHALCVSPINEAMVSEQNNVNDWLQSLNRSESASITFKKSFFLNVETVDVNEDNEADSTYIMGYFYLELSKKLLLNGQLTEAKVHATKAHGLFTQVCVEHPKEVQPFLFKGFQDCLSNRDSKNLVDFYLSPWKALQGILECILQLSIVYETIGNGEQSERCLRTGRSLSKKYNFPLFLVTFSTMLGKLFIRRNRPDTQATPVAEMLDTDDINIKSLGCIHCSSVVQCNLFMAFGEKYESEVRNASAYKNAEKEYKKAIRELSDSQWEPRSKLRPHSECLCSKLRSKLARNQNSASHRAECWLCIPHECKSSSSIKRIIELKWEYVRKHLLLELHGRLGKCTEERKLSDTIKHTIKHLRVRALQFIDAASVPKDLMSTLIAVTIPDETFAIERVRFIHDLCWYSLKYIRSDFLSDFFSDSPSVVFADMISWLKSAFVLSREIPFVFEKVSKLLLMVCAYSRKSEKILMYDNVFRDKYWSAYFHISSVGTHLSNQFHSHFSEKFKGECGFGSSSVNQNAWDVPKETKDLATHMQAILTGHPDFTITTISILGLEYIDLLNGLSINPSLPKDAKGLLIITRLGFNKEPIVDLLPLIGSFPQEVDSEFIDKNSLPTMDGSDLFEKDLTVDDLLARFESVTETFDSLSMEDRPERNATFGIFLRIMEDSWLGKSNCLLLGERRNDSPKRKPIVLVLDYKLQIIPWENFPITREEEVYRMPSDGSIYTILYHYQWRIPDPRKENAMRLPSINVQSSVFFILNPTADERMKFKLLANLLPTLKVEKGAKLEYIPNKEDVELALIKCCLFMYFGHVDGKI